ncbi:hypothetical protein [Microcella alkalica]|uniref:Uncharacterized protein n=1 Tax=Microcella alkalica TaxID=355930 RepID=A0A839EBA4_9MICO|nr:hypothetical protein [Microcella alkalica]MBA8848737.1 hypothetical protein [Microcella alkalica]
MTVAAVAETGAGDRLFAYVADGNSEIEDCRCAGQAVHLDEGDVNDYG